jgi:hypothetical protein
MRAKRGWAAPLLLVAAAGAGVLGCVAALPARPPAGPDAVSIKEFPNRIDFRVGKDLVATYVTDPKMAKPFFWPLNAPGGEPITRPWPPGPGEAKDHPHQKSAWFCHGDVIPEGIELKHKIRGVEGVDFWSEARGHGRIVCTSARVSGVDPQHGYAVTRNEWRTADDVKVLDETRVIHLYNLGGARLLVLDIDLCAGTVPVTFGDTKEGALGVRVRQSLTEKAGEGGRLTNADGKTGEEKVKGNKDQKGCWGVVSAWCDDSGPVGGQTAGIAIFADPSNPYPTAWHSRGYGLMAANPFGRDKSGFPALKGKKDLVKLAKGEHLKLRYGLFLHAGDVMEGRVAEYFERFVKLRASEAIREKD